MARIAALSLAALSSVALSLAALCWLIFAGVGVGIGVYVFILYYIPISLKQVVCF